MTPYDQQHDRAFAAMTLDIVQTVLGLSDSLPAVVRVVIERIRELSGARTVMMFQFVRPEGGESAYRLLDVVPERRKGYAESADVRRLLDLVGEGSEPVLWRFEAERSEAETALESLRYKPSLALPLLVGATRVGVILVLGLLDDPHMTATVRLQETLSGTVALVLRNSVLFEQLKVAISELEEAEDELTAHKEHLEDVVAERTRALAESNQALRREMAERKRAEDERREMERRMSVFYRQTISSVTGGKLGIRSAADIEPCLATRGLTIDVSEASDVPAARRKVVEACLGFGLDKDEVGMFACAVGEAIANAVKHAARGRVHAGRIDDQVWVGVEDNGPGIECLTLPGTVLCRGFSTKASMGLGYSIMLDASDRVLLKTGPDGTTVILVKNLGERPSELLALPDTW